MNNKDDSEFEDLEQYDYFDDEYLETVIKKYTPLIGKFLIEFSALEHQINLLIAEIINSRAHNPGYVIIEKLTTNNKIDLFSKSYASLGIYDSNFKENLKSLTKRLNEINTFRNYLVHANWYSLQKNGYVRTKIVIDGEYGYVRFKRVLMTTPEIRKNIKEIYKLLRGLEKFEDDIESLMK